MTSTALSPYTPAAVSTPEQLVNLLESIRLALDDVSEPERLVELARKANAISTLTDEARIGEEIQRQASEIAIRAKRAVGEMLTATIRHQGGRPKESDITLSKLHITDKESEKWQWIAVLPDEKFETAVAELSSLGKELTVAEFVRRGKVFAGNFAKREVSKNPRFEADWVAIAGVPCRTCHQEASTLLSVNENDILLCRPCLAELKGYLK